MARNYASATIVGSVSITLNENMYLGGDFYVWRNVKEALSAMTTRRSEVPKQAAHGVEGGLSHYNARIVPFEGEIHASSVEARIEMEQNLKRCVSLSNLQDYSNEDGYRLVQINDEDGIAKQIYLKLVDFEFAPLVEGKARHSRFRITMIADDPAMYAQELTELTAPESFNSTTFTIEDGGLPTFQDVDLPTFQDVQGQVIQLTNDGTFGSPPLIVLVGPTTNPVIENETTGKQLAFTRNGGLTLAEGDTLTINCEAHTAVMESDGVETSVKSKLSLNSEWFDIVPGVNDITLFDDTPGDITSQIEISFRSAWI